MGDSAPGRGAWAAVVLAALGYFVDLYDLLLFSIVRVKSLKDIGVADADLLGTGVWLLDMQMGGMLLGGILWGVLGDRRGRISVLFGSIFLYSAANLANAYVDSVTAYAWLRLVAGIGLAGELGAGVTLVSELLSAHGRGYGTTIVAGAGFLGGIMAALVGDHMAWRHAYILGGVMGMALLALRFGVYESGMFQAVLSKNVARGSLAMLLSPSSRFLKYICCIAVGLPIWFVIGILITFSPEVGKALGMSPAPEPAKTVLWFYVGSTIGDLGSGLLSQLLRSRRKVLAGFIVAKGLVMAALLAGAADTAQGFYGFAAALGLATGYWAVFVTSASEQFGTNIRATVTTTAPNFVRGAAVPITLSFKAMRGSLGIPLAAGAVGLVCLVLSLAALSRLEETFGKDLDYCET